jgi:hypothetical protein
MLTRSEKLRRMRATANRLVVEVLDAAQKVPADLRGLFLSLVWRGVHAAWAAGPGAAAPDQTTTATAEREEEHADAARSDA